MKLKQFFLSFLLLTGLGFAQHVLHAQEGTEKGIISGTITDINTGEPLIGANVFIEGTATGTATDFDGKYQFKADPGTYTVIVSYTGYQAKNITSFEVKGGEINYLDAALSDQTTDLDIGVVVTAQAIERTENALLLLQKKSDKIQDGISSQEMSRYGVGDAAAAMKKVTGTTVEDGKFIIVRGLGDRYSTAQLNGVLLPSTNPYRNAAQLDLIPSNLLDNIITSKSFTPDQPGTFTGGNVNLQTKSFPEQFTLKFTTSFSVNTQSSFIDNFLSHPGGETDWLGYDDGTREIPDILADPKSEDLLNRTAAILARRDDEIAEQVDRIANSVSPFMEPTRKSVPLDHGFSLGIGNQYSLFGKPLGFIFSASYNRSYSYYQNAQATNWFYNGNPEATSLSRYFDLRETRGIENPKVGGMIGFSYKLSPLNQLSFNTLYNHNTDKLTLFQQGEHPDFEIFLPEVFQSRTLQFRERQIINYQLSGEHSIPAFNQMKIEWTASLANSSQEEPDLRFFASEFNPERDEYAIRQSNYNLPTHFWRDLQDDQVEGKIDFTLPVLQSANKGNKLQFGGLYFDKQRDFEELRFSIVESPSVSQRYEGDEMAYFGPENTGLIGETESGRNRIGNFIDSDTRPENSYIGSKEVWASYLMGTFQLAPRWKFIGGARVESTDIRVQTKSAAATEGVIDQLDVLPSASLIYSLTENMNIRAAYSKTIARPNMRELAPFASFEFIGDAIFIGNPNLDRTRITNADLRWEIFPAAGELFALSAYYKDFDDPIVQAFTNVSNPEYRYVNVDQARVYGLEIEMRKGLGFIADDLSNFKFSSNMSLIRSSVDIPESELMVRRLYNPGTDDTRPFQGQSDFIVNAALAYLDRDRGWDAALSFNIFGDRLAVVGQEGTPDIFEQSRGQLDLTISKDLAEFLSVRVSASNLLNAKYRTSSDFKGQEFVYRNYLLGRTFGLSVSYLIN